MGYPCRQLCIEALVFLTFLAVLPFSVAASAGEAPQPAPNDPLTLTAVGPAQLKDLLEDPHDPYAILRAQIAIRERQGQLPIGFTDTFARKDLPIDRDLHDAHLVCDLDADGRQDILVNNFGGLAGSQSWITAESGVDGTELWYRDNLLFSTMPGTTRVSATPPRVPENVFPIVDANNDGVCDVLAYGRPSPTGAGVPITGPSVTLYEVVIHLIDGATGEDIWSLIVPSACGPVATVNSPTSGGAPSSCRVDFGDPLLGTWSTTLLYNFPTGLLAFDTDEGPRFVFKTTDMVAINADPTIGILPIQYEDLRFTEHIFVYDATTGAPIWQRDLNPEQNGEYTNTTFITGVAQLVEGGPPEIILDQMFIHNPRTNELPNPVTGRPLFQNGRGMSMIALNGETGQDAWSTLVFEEGAIRPNAPVEENFAVLLWTFGEIVGDLNGDGVFDPVAQYLTIEANMAATLNGGFRTHLMPLDGTNGLPLWNGQDRFIQGWGFVRGLNAAEGLVSRLAIGTIDLPTQTPPIGRFPPKDVRIAVIDSTDGATVWEYREQFAQDSYLPYVLTLNQYREALAPFDWDGDGLRDLLTPARYVPPGYEQLLLTTTIHDYQVLNASNGNLLYEVPAWGPNGVAVNCPGAQERLTVLAGHGRRLDFARYNVTTFPGERPDIDATNRDQGRDWARRVWMDPTLPRAATASFDVTFLAGRCQVADDGMIFVFANTGLFSRQRGIETVPIRGFLFANGTLDWQVPEIYAQEEILDFLELTDIANQPPSDLGLAIGLATAPLIPGALIGGVALAVRARKVRALLGVTLVLLLSTTLVAPAFAFDVPAPVPVDDSVVSAQLGRDAAQEPVPPRQVPPDEALTQFADAVTSDANLDAGTMRQTMADYYSTIGLPGARQAEPVYEFAENDSISYSYNIGDVDLDGTDDLLLDTYCAGDGFACSRLIAAVYTEPMANVEQVVNGQPCTAQHRLGVRSGADAHEIWGRDINPRSSASPLTCTQNYLIGTVGTGPVKDLIMYRFHTTDASYPFVGVGQLIEHVFSRVDGATGEQRWSMSFNGTFSGSFVYVNGERQVARGENVFVVPILQTRRDLSIPLQVPDMEESLHLQGIGFERLNSAIPTFGQLPPFPGEIPIVEAYQSNEWAARVDLETGQLLWRLDTFQTENTHNMQPATLAYGYAQGNFDSPEYKAGHYWNPDICCGDLTGDKVPDLVYRVFESSAVPTTNVEGPYEFLTRIVVLDGATGQQAYSTILQADVDVSLDVQAQNIGDANGDGAADILARLVHEDYEFLNRVLVLSGKDGTELWHYDSPRTTALYVLGDANRDGGNDFAMVSWYNHTSFGALVNGFLTNVTDTPVKVVSGRTGEVLWTRDTLAAPIDIVQTFNLMTVNGPPDVNGDHIGDLVFDDPLYLPDLTVIHRQTIVSGADGTDLFSYIAAGGFAFPSRAGDLDGDGKDELVLLSGDVVDLWLTLFDGDSGTPSWSRRVLAPRLSNYVLATPLMRAEPGVITNQTERDLFLNFHFSVLTRIQGGTSYCVGCGGETYSESAIDITVPMTYPRLSRLSSTNGSLPWAVPWIYEANLTRLVEGATPASVLYERATSSPKTLDPETIQLSALSGGLIATASLSTSALAVFIGGRRWIR